MIQYLKSEVYYNDLYDLWTIKDCLRICEYWNRQVKDLKGTETGVVRWGLDLELHFFKGERYRNKRAVLNEWVEADRKRDEKLDATEEPKAITCLGCSGAMRVILKDLYDFDRKAIKVLFFFECPQCGKRRGIFDDGQEYVSKGTKLSRTEIKKWEKKDSQRKERKQKDQELLRQYRDEFCLTAAEGEDYILSSNRLKAFADYLSDIGEKKADPAYEKAMKLKKLTIVELEKLLKGTLEKEKYIQLTFDRPIIDKHVVVPLTVQDENALRDEYQSVRTLQRTLKKALDGTNWRLMSEGVSYRLGYLFCKLKGYEQEADLIQIVKSRKSKS